MDQAASETLASADRSAAAESRRADARAAAAAYDVAAAQADGEHKIAIANCEALSGDAQKACLDQADAVRDSPKRVPKRLRRTTHKEARARVLERVVRRPRPLDFTRAYAHYA